MEAEQTMNTYTKVVRTQHCLRTLMRIIETDLIDVAPHDMHWNRVLTI